MKLSERLQSRLNMIEESVKSFGLSTKNLCQDHEWFILSECLQIVRKVEEAPVGQCVEVGNLEGQQDADGNQFVGMLIECPLAELRNGGPIIYRKCAVIPVDNQPDEPGEG